jgi:hypothetical protein
MEGEMKKFLNQRFCNVVIALVALSVVSDASAQRVDSTGVNKLLGKPQKTSSPQSVVNSLQNSSSQNASGWTKSDIRTFDYEVISGALDTVAGKVVVNGLISFSYSIATKATTYVKLFRNGELIQSWPVPEIGSPVPFYDGPDSGTPYYNYTYGGSIPVNYVDQPGAGRHTYSVQIQGGGCCWPTTLTFNGGSLVLWQ